MLHAARSTVEPAVNLDLALGEAVQAQAGQQRGLQQCSVRMRHAKNRAARAQHAAQSSAAACCFTCRLRPSAVSSSILKVTRQRAAHRGWGGAIYMLSLPLTPVNLT